MSRDDDGSIALPRCRETRRETPQFSGGQTSPSSKVSHRKGGQSLGILEGIGGRRGGVGARGIRAWRRTSDALDAHHSRRGREPTPLLGETVSQKGPALRSLRRPVVTSDLTGGCPRLIWAVGTSDLGLFSSAAGRQFLSINCADPRRNVPSRCRTVNRECRVTGQKSNRSANQVRRTRIKGDFL